MRTESPPLPVCGRILAGQGFGRPQGFIELLNQRRCRSLGRRITLHHATSELRKVLAIFGRAGVMRSQTEVLRGEAKSQGSRELLEGLHLAVKPQIGVWTE